MEENLDMMSEPILYDIFNLNCVEDIEMYKMFCTNDKSVLELGIGTGRLAIPLAQNGVNVIGIDNSTNMLNLLENKINTEKINGISYYKQDMRTLSLKTKFDLIICAFCTFNFLLSIHDQEKALMSIRNLMHNETKIVFDLLTINTFSGFFQDSSLKHFDSYRHSTNKDIKIEIYTSNKFDQCNQIFSQERIFRQYSNDVLSAEFHTTMKNRLFFLGEFQLLLDKCGYKILSTYGNYKFSPFSKSSRGLIVIAALK